MALIQLVNNISSAMDSRESTAGVFLDLSKAFDTILIIIFCSISSITTVLEGILRWVSSYLTNRKQHFSLL